MLHAIRTVLVVATFTDTLRCLPPTGQVRSSRSFSSSNNRSAPQMLAKVVVAVAIEAPAIPDPHQAVDRRLRR